MKCPHCKSDQHTVFETRNDGTDIYRRRCCKKCFKYFVTLETAPVGLKMPAKLQIGGKRRAKLKPGQSQYQAPEIKEKIGKNSNGKDLQKVWG